MTPALSCVVQPIGRPARYSTGAGRFLSGVVGRLVQVGLDEFGRSLLQCREAFVAATGGA
jgi:hypothetical protein